jgi:hypothetical protein
MRPTSHLLESLRKSVARTEMRPHALTGHLNHALQPSGSIIGPLLHTALLHGSSMVTPWLLPDYHDLESGRRLLKIK